MDTSYTLRDTIIDSVRSGQWRAGDRLPTERVFADKFKLSRTTVRKVLQAFREQGLISQTVGSGTYVTEQAAAILHAQAADTPATQISPAVLMEARLALEPAIIDMVIGNATSADFEQMERCCDNAERSASVEEFEVWDGKLHEVIAHAAHNAFVANVFKLMNDARAQGEWGMLKKAQPHAGAAHRLPGRASRPGQCAQEPGPRASQGTGDRPSAARAAQLAELLTTVHRTCHVRSINARRARRARGHDRPSPMRRSGRMI